MTKAILVVAALAAAGTLAACGQKESAQAPVPAATPAAMPAPAAPAPADGKAADMAKMGMSSKAKMGKGRGTVTEVNAATGTLTLDHGAMPDVGWPAMVMAFKADPSLLGGIKVGDKVAFDLKVGDGAPQVTAIQKQ